MSSLGNGRQRKPVTLYLPVDVYEEFKRRNPNVSKRVAELMEADLAKQGVDLQPLKPSLEEEIEQLTKERLRLQRDIDCLEKRLSKELPSLEKLAEECGVKPDLSNLEETIPKMLEAWRGYMSTIQDFITLLRWKRMRNQRIIDLNKLYQSFS